MIERQILINTKDGQMNTFICHPERANPHPVILLYMDAPGIREELRDMARRLGTAGYYVMLPNLYYRSAVEDMGPFIGDAHLANRQRIMSFIGTIDIPKVMSDTDALIDFAEHDPAASKGAMGAVGYCMSGRYAINAAVEYPDRVRAAASIYGVGLVTDQSDSPHLAPRKTDAKLYFACAQTDQYAPQEMIDSLIAELDARKANAEVEMYPGTHHGFAFPQRPVYDKPSAERHWERLFSLFKGLSADSQGSGT
jgi:carboxymethylenebutenolidase